MAVKASVAAAVKTRNKVAVAVAMLAAMVQVALLAQEGAILMSIQAALTSPLRQVLMGVVGKIILMARLHQTSRFRLYYLLNCSTSKRPPQYPASNWTGKRQMK